jgi:hypothetical protein
MVLQQEMASTANMNTILTRFLSVNLVPWWIQVLVVVEKVIKSRLGELVALYGAGQ